MRRVSLLHDARLDCNIWLVSVEGHRRQQHPHQNACANQDHCDQEQQEAVILHQILGTGDAAMRG
ncbi:MAG: hypothetical protein EBU40_02885 [Proteobacteria bacterium]|nr:hypothetical protein [Pseudomonadota bacterium]NBQ30363.1 hypothetical protein [Pseudomonadota bacterium]NBQ61210.1 hypothetical protein [Pseudomonadota bacterium]NBT17211.1 hypothetical protein [Pseudomonadota bacterium]NDB70982.1 hypothetical protein [Pseudomonadota bacterium]